MNTGWPCVSCAVTRGSQLIQSGRFALAVNWATVVGSISSDEAKMAGITPAVLTFSGRKLRSPPVMRLPSWRFGYWIRRRRWARSMKTMKTMTATAMMAMNSRVKADI